MAYDQVIEKFSVSSLRAPLVYPFRTALGQHDSLENILFRLELRGGITGVGEAAIATHITGETIPQTIRNLNVMGAQLLGRDIRAYASISAFLHEHLSRNKAALAAIEMALGDALTKSRQMPLWKFFGPRPVQLKTDITIVIDDLLKTKSAVKKFYRQGFRVFKVKIGRDQDLDFKRVSAVKVLAPTGIINLDANQGYTADAMISFLRTLKARGIRPHLVEQPVPRDDWDGLIKISQSGLARVCADESVRSLADCRRLIRFKAAQVVNIKLMKTGLWESREIACLVRRHGLRLMIGGMMESPLAMTAAAHFAAGLGEFHYVDLDTPFFIRGGLSATPYLNSCGVYNLKGAQRGIDVPVAFETGKR